MTMQEFIRANQAEIDARINRIMFASDGNGGPGVIPDPPPVYDDEDREQWIEGGDEWLYIWAKGEGVRV